MIYQSAAAQAEVLTKGARNASYGHPLDDYTKTGWLMTPVLLEKWVAAGLRRFMAVHNDPNAATPAELLEAFGPVPAEAAILCMVQVKVSRELNVPSFENRTDGCGYFEALNMAVHERWRRGGS